MLTFSRGRHPDFHTCTGSIIIDDQDTARAGLRDLRSRLTIISQYPNLSKGTIRSNLDAFSQYTDLELWSTLRQSTLIPKDDISITAANPATSTSTTPLRKKARISPSAANASSWRSPAPLFGIRGLLAAMRPRRR